MARSRNIKPAFFKNETLAECPPLARLLFAGLWCIADRAGRLEDRPKRIRAEILPYDDGSVDDMLNDLHKAGFILRYGIGEKRYIQVLNFGKHQNPHCREPNSTIPAPGEHGACSVQASDEHGSGPADCLNLIPDSPIPCSDADASVVASEALPTCPHQEILEAYAKELAELPQPRSWDGNRATAMRARWKWILAEHKRKGKPHDKAAGLDYFQGLFAYISQSDFLMGRAGKWQADLGWIMKAENFAKIIQGNYENTKAVA